MSTLKLPRDQIAAQRAEDLQLYVQGRCWTPADVWRLRLRSPETASGTVGMEDGLHLIQGGRDLLLAAACSAHQQQAYFSRESFAPAVEFLRGCRLANTDSGAFVARIITPVPPALSSAPFPDNGEEDIPTNEPYERRVTLCLMAALKAIESAVAEGRPEKILYGVPQGVSANLCEALATMTPANPQASLELSISWSRARPCVPQQIPDRVAFSQGQFVIIREAGRRLREGHEPRRERIPGSIITLHAKPSQSLSPFEGNVVVWAEFEGHANCVRFVLPRADYARACDAHRDGQRISVTGVLQWDPQARMFELLQARDFQVHMPEPAAT